MWKVVIWKYKTSDPVTYPFHSEVEALKFYYRVVNNEDNYNVAYIHP